MGRLADFEAPTWFALFDVRYGQDERNVVDIFIPKSGAAGRPVLMFVHGGGMIRRIKRAPGSPLLATPRQISDRSDTAGPLALVSRRSCYDRLNEL
jgi:hypothetical protein